jgi:hypothetical protein
MPTELALFSALNCLLCGTGLLVWCALGALLFLLVFALQPRNTH